MLQESTSVLPVQVHLQPSQNLLIFAHRQVAVLGGELLTRTASGLVPTGTKLVRRNSPIALELDRQPHTYDNLVARVEYLGLPPLFVRAATTAQLAIAAFDSQPLDARRINLVNAMPSGASQVFAQQFTEFDDDTDAASAPAAANAFLVREILMNRVVRRAAWSVHGLPFPGDSVIRTTLRTLPDVTQKTFRDALDRFKTNAGPGFDLAQFRGAFAAFTCGELRLDLGPGDQELRFCGVPDSAYFLCFAEAAFWFHELDMDRQFWAALLPLFVGATEVFKELYWDNVNGRSRFAYSRGIPTTARASAALLDSVARTYQSMSIEQLAARFASFAAEVLADEVRHVEIVPGALPRALRRVNYQLLVRAPGSGGGGSGDDTSTFSPADTPQQRTLFDAIKARLSDARIPFHDDPELQDLAVRDHVAQALENQVFQDLSTGTARSLKLDLCNPKSSRYNPTSGGCDPIRFGSSWRFCFALDSAAPCPIAAAGTELELIVETLPSPFA